MKSQVRPRRAFTFVGVTCSNPERKILSVWRLYIFLKKNCILQFPRESFKCCMKRKTFSFKFNIKWIQNNYYNKFTTVFFFLTGPKIPYHSNFFGNKTSFSIQMFIWLAPFFHIYLSFNSFCHVLYQNDN